MDMSLSSFFMFGQQVRGQDTTMRSEHEQFQKKIRSRIPSKLPESDVQRLYKAVLADIRTWIEEDPEKVGERINICGILWIGDDILISTARFKKLLGKSGPTVNCALNALGYKFQVMPSQTSEYDRALKELVRYIPTIKENPEAQKQWTLRRRCHSDRTCAVKSEPSDEPADANSTSAPVNEDSPVTVPSRDSILSDDLLCSLLLEEWHDDAGQTIPWNTSAPVNKDSPVTSPSFDSFFSDDMSLCESFELNNVW